MLLPVAKPNIAVYVIVKGIESAAGSHVANVTIRHRATVRIIVLNRPILSAAIPGTQRPKNDPAFMIARS